MRFVAGGSFDRLSSRVNLWRAYQRCRAEKSRHPAMARFDLDADLIVVRLHRALHSGQYEPGPFRLHLVRDPKVRLIAAAPIRDRIVHQSLVREIAPPFEAAFIHDSYAGMPGKGAHRAVLRYLTFVRTFRFRLSLDIQRYFPSIVHTHLLDLLFRRVRDSRTRRLLETFVERGGTVYKTALARRVLGDSARDAAGKARGMPIGSYLSQWAGNVYLDGLDHFVKRQRKIQGYVRYMDDFTLFADECSTLEKARDAIVEWLGRERELALNEKRWHVHPTSTASVFLGYRVTRSGLGASRKLRRRLASRVRVGAAKGRAALLRTLASYRGLLLFGA